MIRFVGALLAFLGCFSMGLIKLKREKAELSALEAVCDALGQMRVELSSRLAPIPELAGILSRRTQGDARRFFALLCSKLNKLGERELCELWCECAETELCALNADALRDFIALGQILGRGELDLQLAAIARCEASSRQTLAEGRTRFAGQRRLTLGVSASAGLMLVIMLI